MQHNDNSLTVFYFNGFRFIINHKLFNLKSCSDAQYDKMLMLIHYWANILDKNFKKIDIKIIDFFGILIRQQLISYNLSFALFLIKMVYKHWNTEWNCVFDCTFLIPFQFYIKSILTDREQCGFLKTHFNGNKNSVGFRSLTSLWLHF